MKRNTQDDLRYIKTENLIRKTFKDMLSEMDYAQISIKDLTERAMINRKTFYLHYGSLDELLGKLQVELYTDLLPSLSDITLPDELDQLVRTLFLFWANADPINEKILCSQGNFPLGKSPGDYANKIMFQRYRPNDFCFDIEEYRTNIVNAYLSGSFISIYTQWIKDGRKIPIEEIISTATKLIAAGLSVIPVPGIALANSPADNK